MDIDFEDLTVIRCKLNNDELAELVAGERLIIDLDKKIQLEIYHVPSLSYDRKNYLNGENNEHDTL